MATIDCRIQKKQHRIRRNPAQNMSSKGDTPTLLGPYRVLDLADEKGDFCGKLLGDLGADVIKVEKPGGDPTRNIGPLYHDIPDPEKSLRWFSFNTSKRGITLDISSTTGKAVFEKLVKTADFLIETFEPGYMESLGLGYDVLNHINPGLIMASITPFGQTGPYRDYRGSDIVASAMGGLMNIQGDPDRAPLRAATEQAYLQGGLQAAVGVLAANCYREISGEGQYVDVSLQECMAWTLDNAALSWEYADLLVTRQGSKRQGTTLLYGTACRSRDGLVAVMPVMGGEAGITLLNWIKAERKADGFTDSQLAELEADWGDPIMLSQEMSQEAVDNRERIAGEFFATRTTEELMKAAQDKGLELTAMCTPEDLFRDVQLNSRDYFVEVAHPELEDTLTYPGNPYRLSETPWKIHRRAPLIGEHNEEIYHRDLGYSREELRRLKQAGVI